MGALQSDATGPTKPLQKNASVSSNTSPQNMEILSEWFRYKGEGHRDGQGVPQNYKTAVKWYKLAAEQGYALAQYNLGFMYGNGQGVPQDYILTHMWWNLAASSGQIEAVKNRDLLAERMSSSQIEKAQKLARDVSVRNTKDVE